MVRTDFQDSLLQTLMGFELKFSNFCGHDQFNEQLINQTRSVTPNADSHSSLISIDLFSYN